MKRVYIVLKHARYPYGMDVKYTQNATIEAVFDNKADAFAMAKHKDKNNTGKYSVVVRMVLSGFAAKLVDPSA